MAAFAVAQALRGGRGPTVAALALGRRTLFRADASRTPLHALPRRSLASGNGTEVAGGKGTGWSGAGMEPVHSWGGCTGGCAREIMDLRAEMMDRTEQLWTRVFHIREEKVAVCKEIAKYYTYERMTGKQYHLKTASRAVAASLVLCLGTVGYSWQKSKKSTESDHPLVRKDGGAAVARPPKEEAGGAAVARPPKEEHGGAAVARPPKEEHGGAAVTRPPKEEHGGAAVARPPKEEVGGGAVARPPKQDDGGGAVATPPKDEHRGEAVAKSTK